MTQTQGAPGPAIIFLEPLPCDPNTGRQWCEDDVWDEGGVAYVRSDLAAAAHLRSTSPAGEVGEALVELDGSDFEAVRRHAKTLRSAIERLAASDTEAMRLLRADALDNRFSDAVIGRRFRQALSALDRKG